MDLCQYKDIFGKPNQGVHKYRIMGLALVDVVMTVIAAMFISYVWQHNPYAIILLLFILGVIFHKVFCVETKLNKMIFG